MKKLSLILVSLMLAMVLVCSSFAEEGMAGMVNPWQEMGSLEELHEAAGVHLELPGVMGVSDVYYRLMKTEDLTMAELDFSVNGMEYCFRASRNLDEDISGVYTESGDTAFSGVLYENPSVVISTPYKLARWQSAGVQYVLCLSDEENTMEQETFEGIADEMMSLTLQRSTELAAGKYWDAYSMRAHAAVSFAGDDAYAIEIHWSDSAFEYYAWTMTAAFAEDGCLVYNDCVLKQVVTDENGNETETEANLIPDGWFEVSDGILYWTGAADNYCRSCAFEPAAE